ncbi:MAG: hypothetical protein QGD92_11495 [Gammaproteobacteria bacterium]|nr:hypothetical protein [Gammaproteobacteria bacterium]
MPGSKGLLDENYAGEHHAIREKNRVYGHVDVLPVDGLPSKEHHGVKVVI